MYNLLIKGSPWGSGRDTIDLDRVFEHTHKDIKAKFSEGDVLQFDKLIEFPCLFMQKGFNDKPAYIGNISRTRVSQKVVSIEYAYDRDIPSIPNNLINQNMHDFGIINDYEFGRTHWAVKDVDLYQMLLRNPYPPRRQRPSVFKIPDYEKIEPTLASVMMPFDASFTEVYETIKATVKKVGLACQCRSPSPHSEAVGSGNELVGI